MVSVVDQSRKDDEQLAAEVAREDSNGPAFMELFERHRERTWRICYRFMGNEHDAHDAAQEVFIRMFLQRARFAGRSKYATWLHGIIVRTCLELRRNRGRRAKRESTMSELAVEHQSIMPEATHNNLSQDLMRMLATLEEEDRFLIILKYAEGYNYEELSAIFERSISALKMRIARACEKLREQFPEAANTHV